MSSDGFAALVHSLTSASSRRALVGPALAAVLAGVFRADLLVAKKGKRKKGICRRVRLAECNVCRRAQVRSQPDGTPCSYGGACQSGVCTGQICTPAGPCPADCSCLRPPSVAEPVCVMRSDTPRPSIEGVCPEACPAGTICVEFLPGSVFCYNPCPVP